jgi:hypothetical protein
MKVNKKKIEFFFVNNVLLIKQRSTVINRKASTNLSQDLSHGLITREHQKCED